MSTISTLRAVANRLNSASTDDLPHQVGYLATSISSCQSLLQNPSPNNDHATVLHKLKTRVSALLQDRTPEGRFCGIVIAKALVAAGGTTILSDSGNWVRAIISCLNKSDSVEVKRLGLLTVTHTYLLTVEHQQFVRDITTPTLPAFISATLGIIRPSSTTNPDGKVVQALSPLLEAVLRSWDTLITHFASTIRPNSSSMKSICLSLVSSDACSANVQEAAQDVLAKLHFCAPKNTGATEWSQSCSQILDAAHDTADLVFRAVVEEWTSARTRTSKVTRKQKTASIPSTGTSDVAGMDTWTGISQGCSRIERHIHLLQCFFVNRHNLEIHLPLGALFDLTSRLAAITIPSAKYSPRIKSDITREEREELWLNMPRIHSSILQLYQAMVEVFGQALYPVCNIILTQIWDILEAEHDHETIRATIYELITSMLSSRLFQFSKSDSVNVKSLIKYCSEDLLPAEPTTAPNLSMANGIMDSNKSTNGIVTAAQSKHRHASSSYTQTTLYSHAYNLVPALLTYANLHVLAGSPTIRAQLDSTAVLLNHHEALLASVLNPPNTRATTKRDKQRTATPSLLPFLARSMEQDNSYSISITSKLGYEALLRPRMPVIHAQPGPIATNTDMTESQDPEEEDDDAPTDEEGDTTMLNGYVPLEAQDHPINSKPPHNPLPKRDFTTLLDQSADAQLAASAANPSVPVHPQYSLDIPVTKRARITTDELPSMSAFEGIEVDPVDLSSNSNSTISALLVNSTLTPLAGANTNTNTNTNDDADTAVPSPIQTSHPTKHDYNNARNPDDDADDNNSDSDSDIPLIDATLVGLSDSEDEE